MRYRYKLIFSLLACCAANVQGQNGEGPPVEDDFLDLLMFLGEFETEQGEWMDPEELASEVYDGLESSVEDDEEDE